jgi:hypothetical protein
MGGILPIPLTEAIEFIEFIPGGMVAACIPIADPMPIPAIACGGIPPMFGGE